MTSYEEQGIEKNTALNICSTLGIDVGFDWFEGKEPGRCGAALRTIDEGDLRSLFKTYSPTLLRK